MATDFLMRTQKFHDSHYRGGLRRKRHPQRPSAVQRVPQKQLDLFRRNLKRLRNKAGLSQEELAERAEITARYLQSIEAGDFGASLAVLIRLRRALRCSWNRFFDGID